ncbi:MAG: asparagine synthase (glutamine-hydrolyzing) [Thermoguttaceae bacterium]
MCGITGGIWTEPRLAIDPQTLRRMTDVLRHRGPDDEGLYTSYRRGSDNEGSCASDLTLRPGRLCLPGVALGHRRLAIIDVAGGRQPLPNENETVWVVFNGEIYNFPALRRRLEGRGHRFRTHSDTETLVHLYEDEGPEMVGLLDGMFAFALWDAERCLLLLARDRLGKKPLVYRHEPGRLLFASQLKSLLQVPGVSRHIDMQALDEYLTYQYVPHPRTIWQGICKLPPGHLAIYREDRIEIRPYWQPDFRIEERLSSGEYASRLRSQLTAAVEARLQSEVPLGAFLSGGLDSTIVVGLMRQLVAGPLRTFSIGFPVPEYDETRYARLAAARFQTTHEEFRVEPKAVEILPRLVWHFDEPFADSSALPTWYLAELTRQHVTVALTGDGGDELFAGYPRYGAVWLADRVDHWPAALRWLAVGSYWQKIPSSSRQKSRLRQWKRFAGGFSHRPARRYLEWISIFGEARRAWLYREEHLARLPDADPLEFLTQALLRSRGRDAVTAVSLADLLTYLPCDLMTKVDAASMAFGLECRQPFLDHRVVELAARMPASLKFRRGRGKRILLEAFADLLPPPIRRRRKMGFGVPLDHWFRQEMRNFAREILFDPQTQSRGFFRPEAVRRLFDDHVSGQADHSQRLWSLLVLELWQREWVH